MVDTDTNRALVAGAGEVLVPADASRWGVVGMSMFAVLDEVDVLITDSVPGAVRETVSRLVSRLVVAA